MPGAPTVIVGASLAGIRAAETLRREGFAGRLVVIGAEPHLPYDRPPLSKRALTHPDADLADLTSLRVEDGLDIDWRLGVEATGLDLERRRVVLGTGEEVGFDRLVIATGASPRSLPGITPGERVHHLRTIEDAAALRSSLAAGSPVAIVGAGFIGLEVASSCRDRGLEVAVVEALPVPLERAVGARIGEAIARRHREAGTRLITGATVERVEGGRDLEGLRLSDGTVVPAGVVVVGVGVSPCTGWLAGSGVDVADGVICDSRLRVLSAGRPLPGVVAAGDVARWAHPGHPGTVRLEHWTNAAESGEAAARSLLHGDAAAAFAPLPYFWSDQLGVKLQMVGLAGPGDDVAFVEGDGTGRKWVAAYGRSGRLTAVLGSGRPARVAGLRRSIESGGAFPPEERAAGS